MSYTRPTGALAQVIDPTRLLELGRTAYLTQHPDAAPAALSHGPIPQMLLAIDENTLHAVVNSEGVGAIIDNDTIDVFFTADMTRLPLAIPFDEIRTALTDETIDIADGIRTFGARLDNNHALWHRRHRN